MQDHKPYIPAVKTDVAATFERNGFVPPSKLPEYQAKWLYYRTLHLKDGHEEQECTVAE